MAERIVRGGGLLVGVDEPLRFGWGVWIADGRVGEVGPNDELAARHAGAEILNAEELLLMPGLIDAHLHAYGRLAHGLVADDPPDGFYPFLADYWWPEVEDRLDEAMIEAAMQHACCQMIRSGVTGFCDVLEAPNAPAGVLDVEADVVHAAGLRAVLMTEASERISTARGEWLLEENAAFARAHRDDTRVRGMLCLHTSFTCSESFVRRARGMMDDLSCDLHLHLSESPHEPETCRRRYGTRPVDWYDRMGLWGRDVLASQVVSVTDDELETLAGRGVRVAHMPLSNCEVGGGVAPVPGMIARGMRPGLGTDGYIGDLFEVMRGAFLIHKGVLQSPKAMPASAVLHMATDWGAAAIGLENVGRLDPGYSADLIGLDCRFDTPVTPRNALDQVVLFRGAGDVRLSIVAGDILLNDRRLLTMDEERARGVLAEQARRLWRGAVPQ